MVKFVIHTEGSKEEIQQKFSERKIFEKYFPSSSKIPQEGFFVIMLILLSKERHG